MHVMTYAVQIRLGLSLALSLTNNCPRYILNCDLNMAKSPPKHRNTYIHLLRYTVFLHGGEKLHYGNDLR